MANRRERVGGLAAARHDTQGRITHFLSLSLSPTAYNVGYFMLCFLRAAMTFEAIHPLWTNHVVTSTSRT